MALLGFDARPCPALTPQERFHLDHHGFVVLPSALSEGETAVLYAEVQQLHSDLVDIAERGGDRPTLRGANLSGFDGSRARGDFAQRGIGNLLECGGAITGYAAHPRLVAAAEELLGCEARIVEQNSIINRRDDTVAGEPGRHGIGENFVPPWHRGADPRAASHEQNGLLHCNFVKTLTNLTPLGKDDGGTLVIPGSHRMSVDQKELAEMVAADPALVHQVVAPAGSTLLFGETLVHATGPITSERERTIITTGYAPPNFPYWDNIPSTDNQSDWRLLSDDFRASIPPELENLFLGRRHWNPNLRYRPGLMAPLDPRVAGLRLPIWRTKPAGPKL